MHELAIFAGAGGGILGGHLLGWRTVCAVERDAYAAQVLAQRQNDRALPAFPIWSDVRSFDGRPWRGLVDLVSGGFPCQDISAAGTGTGIDGSRSGLWREMARIIGEIRPASVLLENSPLLVGRGLAVVLGDLAELGYDAHWRCLSAADFGAPHKRNRIWLVADTHRPWQPQQARQQQQECRMGPEQRGQTVVITDQPPRQPPTALFSGHTCLADARSEHVERLLAPLPHTQIRGQPRTGSTGPRDHGFGPWPPEPDVGRVADGVAHRLDRLKALGNGQVPRVAAAAFDWLYREG
ncbi:DNA cytosine methyltransferase [Pseudomonas sp. SLFW]|nr:DNA cytosine methyltransferase [Pseudomonas sp. SLFW]